ncbi:Uncharacterized protein similar to C2H2 type zinc finger protein [Klebsormidium nitens]|uniref:Uncharacterized protein similar to C2H2 type zinc finger protein n=1 Tax=Klebsormidium nitens TaxID=105231 RepID=A0A1Y1IS90_KLENI|nr:Uncharacterized protein similar to C2H2 type zinc finger protein [Klebsormidium nitens]|eukprot:TRINITY_DN16443_c0_g1_i1.p2 TRINITY_DN16443_c0_g1~~TRINITY_DN16443_c0_g1_i1.p2  ORF type:complete len:104 (-),score=9.22 TRINITY_DN16443_c0_g1_i1:608-919(-)
MTGKAKPKKHTAKELAAKADAALTNRGGGVAGKVDRLGLDKGGHAKYACQICKATAPDTKSMQIHWEAKHPKLPWDPEKIIDQHAAIDAANKAKPGIRGSIKK